MKNPEEIFNQDNTPENPDGEIIDAPVHTEMGLELQELSAEQKEALRRQMNEVLGENNEEQQKPRQ